MIKHADRRPRTSLCVCRRTRSSLSVSLSRSRESFQLGWIAAGHRRWIPPPAGVGRVILELNRESPANRPDHLTQQLVDGSCLRQFFARHFQVQIAIMLDRIAMRIEQGGVPVTNRLVTFRSVER